MDKCFDYWLVFDDKRVYPNDAFLRQYPTIESLWVIVEWIWKISQRDSQTQARHHIVWIINLLGRPDTWFWCFAICFQIITFCYNSWSCHLVDVGGKKKTYHMRNESGATDVKWENAINVLVVCTYILLQFANHVLIFVRRTNLRPSPEVLNELVSFTRCVVTRGLACCTSEPLRVCSVSLEPKRFFGYLLYKDFCEKNAPKYQILRGFLLFILLFIYFLSIICIYGCTISDFCTSYGEIKIFKSFRVVQGFLSLVDRN
jgi:hypothetical protein